MANIIINIVLILGLFVNFLGTIYLIYAAAEATYDSAIGAMIIKETGKKLFKKGFRYLCYGFLMQITGAITLLFIQWNKYLVCILILLIGSFFLYVKKDIRKLTNSKP